MITALEYCEKYGGEPADIMEWEPGYTHRERHYCPICGAEVDEEAVRIKVGWSTLWYHDNCYEEEYGA